MFRKLLDNRIKIFFYIHVFSLITIGLVSTDHLYHLYHQKKSDTFLADVQKVQQNKYFQYYYRYTGTETAFGFFAPNVRSMGLFMFDYCNKGIDINFVTNEGNARYTSLISNVTDYLADSKPEGKNKSKRQILMEQYSELLLKNITAKYQSKIQLNDQNCNEVTLKYYLVEYPSLDTKSKTKKHDPILINIKNWKYEIVK